MSATITPTENGPLKVEGMAIKNDGGTVISSEAEVYLCRCGQSKNKPFCDGSHTAAGFKSAAARGERRAPREFVGKEITVVDDFSMCAHAGECVDGAPGTFFTKGPDGRISHPDATPVEQVIATIRRCPSGSLLYKIRGKLVDDYATESGIRAEKDGPLHVSRAVLKAESGEPRAGSRPATENHYTLCRCGLSKNKPFCDGAHARGFKAD